MCDYSLHHVASRPAKVGDKLLTSKFFNTPTGGFAAEDDANVAVCLLAGTETPSSRTSNANPRSASFRAANSGSGWPDFGRSIWTSPAYITMRLNSPTARSSC